MQTRYAAVILPNYSAIYESTICLDYLSSIMLLPFLTPHPPPSCFSPSLPTYLLACMHAGHC